MYPIVRRGKNSNQHKKDKDTKKGRYFFSHPCLFRERSVRTGFHAGCWHHPFLPHKNSLFENSLFEC